MILKMCKYLFLYFSYCDTSELLEWLIWRQQKHDNRDTIVGQKIRQTCMKA